MHRFGRCFQSLLRHQMYFATHETFHRYVCRWRHKIRKIAVEILQSVNNRTQSLRDIAYYAWLLLTYIVINTLLGRLTLHPAGTYCPSWDDAFVSSFFLCWSRSESGARRCRGVHSSNKHCVAVYRPISTRFAAFLPQGISVSDTLHSSHILR